MEGSASRMNSHCQPSSPQPVMFSNAPEIGAPMMDEKGMASMKNATTRASVYLYNTFAEIDTFVDALGRVRAYFGRD